MTVTQRVVTFGGSAVQFPAPSGFYAVNRVYAVPLRSNAHISYVGISTVTNDASGVGVIKELATPPAATVGVDSFDETDMNGDNIIDPTQFWAHGTSSEKLLVTYYQR